MREDLLLLIDHIRELIEAPLSGSDAPGLDRLEETLTAGYARALTLEAESLRLGRRLGEIASTMAHSPSDRTAEELAVVAGRMAAAKDEVSRLRELLTALRGRATAVRSGAAAA